MLASFSNITRGKVKRSFAGRFAVSMRNRTENFTCVYYYCLCGSRRSPHFSFPVLVITQPATYVSCMYASHYLASNCLLCYSLKLLVHFVTGNSSNSFRTVQAAGSGC